MLNLTPATRDDDFFNGMRLATFKAPWNRHSELEYNHLSSAVAHHLVTICGKDPRATTTREMDEVNPRFVCRKCSTRDQEFLIMTWRRAVRVPLVFAWFLIEILTFQPQIQHVQCNDHHPLDFLALNELDTQFVKHQEATDPMFDASRFCSWICALCRGTSPTSVSGVKRHCIYT